jgi:hypothetical protein
MAQRNDTVDEVDIKTTYCDEDGMPIDQRRMSSFGNVLNLALVKRLISL